MRDSCGIFVKCGMRVRCGMQGAESLENTGFLVMAGCGIFAESLRNAGFLGDVGCGIFTESLRDAGFRRDSGGIYAESLRDFGGILVQDAGCGSGMRDLCGIYAGCGIHTDADSRGMRDLRGYDVGTSEAKELGL